MLGFIVYLIIIGLIAGFIARFLVPGPDPMGVMATIVGAVIFSAFHYVGPFGDPFQLDSFIFRAVAGLLFSALYLLRGFGIAAWSHALYDVILMLFRAG